MNAKVKSKPQQVYFAEPEPDSETESPMVGYQYSSLGYPTRGSIIRRTSDGNNTDEEVVVNRSSRHNHDEFIANQNLLNKTVRTGRQRKKYAARSKGGEFQSRREKRRVYFCSVSSEIDNQKLHDFLVGSGDLLVGWKYKMHQEVLHLFKGDPSPVPRYHDDPGKKMVDLDLSGSSSLPDSQYLDPSMNIRTSQLDPDLSPQPPSSSTLTNNSLQLLQQQQYSRSLNQNSISVRPTFNPSGHPPLHPPMNLSLSSSHTSLSSLTHSGTPSPIPTDLHKGFQPSTLPLTLALPPPMLTTTSSSPPPSSASSTSSLALTTSHSISSSGGSGGMMGVDPEYRLSPGAQEVFVFDFGAVVFWGFARGEETNLLRTIRMFITKGNVSVQEFHSGEDDMGFVTSEAVEGHSIYLENDVITLSDDTPVKQRLSISFAIAQSSVLAIFEARIERKVEEYKFIPETLAAFGKVHLSEKELGKMIGEVFVIRHDVNLHTEILDIPDFFWKQERFEQDYRLVMNYLEMSGRTEVLNKRLDMLRELLDVLQQQMENAHAVKLEWIVIWLIVVEVVLQVCTIIFAEKRARQLD